MLELNKLRYVNRLLLLSLMVICLSLSRETSLLQAQQDSTTLSDFDSMAQKVLQYVAQTHQLSLEELELHDQGHVAYPLTGRSFQTFFILSHRPEPDPPEYAIWVDESTGQFLDENAIQAIEAAEKTAYQKKYGVLSPRLYERLQQIEAQDILPIAIWVAGTQPSPEEIYAEVITAYPAAQAALTEGLHPRQLEDATLAQTVEQAFDQRLAHYASQRTQSLVAVLQAEQVPIQTISGMPSVVTEASKALILSLAQRSDVTAIYLLSSDASPQPTPAERERSLVNQTVPIDAALATIRVPTLWQRGQTGQGQRIAVIESGNITSNCLNIVGTRDVLWDQTHPYYDPNHKANVTNIAACDAADYRGVAYEADILDVGVTDHWITDNKVDKIVGLKWAIESPNNARIVSRSAGRVETSVEWIDRAFDYWVRTKGIIFVNAAGNNTSGKGIIVTGGKAWNVLTVGGIDIADTASWSDDSMWVDSSYVNPDNRQKPEVVAPAKLISVRNKNNTLGHDEGTSLAAPQVAGLAALLLDRHSGLVGQPNAVKAILMASAVHNIEGSRRLSNKDGAGGVHAPLADQIAQFRQISWSTACTKPCWWVENTSNTSPELRKGFNRYFQAAQGERIRVAMAWFANADTPENDYSFSRLDTNYQMYIYYENARGGWNYVTGSAKHTNNFEIVEFVAPASSRYRIRVYRSAVGDNNEASNSVGLAWVKQATYLPDVRANVDGWQSTIYVRNDGATPVTPIVTFYDSQGTAYGPNNPDKALAPNAVWEYPLTSGQFQGSAIVSGSEDLSVVVAHRHTGPDKVAAYTGVTQPTPNVHVSLLLRNVFGIDSDLAIQNTGHTATDVKVQFTPHPKKDGTVEGRACTQTYTVSANGVRNIDLSGLSCLGNLFVGSAHISNSQNHPLAMATTQEEEQLLTAASNLHPGSSTLYAPLIQYGQPGSWEIFSSGSVQDTSGSTSNITIDYYNVNGSQCRDKSWTYKDIGGHQMNNTIPMPPDGNSCTNPVVAAKIDGGGQNKVAWINQRRGKAVSTYEASGQGSQVISIPYVHNTGHWDTGISMQNVASEATEVTIRYYNADGSHHSTHRVDLAAEGRKTYGWGKPTHEFSGSAVVTADKPIAVTVNVLDYRYAEGQADGLMSYTGIYR